MAKKKEYIERSMAAQMLDGCFRCFCHDCELDGKRDKCRSCTFGRAIIALDEMPAADVVEVVRCMDCAYFDPSDKSNGESGVCMINRCLGINVVMLGSEFCSRGEKRGED